MPFQSSILPQMGAGVVGELAFGGPLRGQPGLLRSGGGAANNIIGRAVTWVSGATGSPIPATPSTDPAPLVVRAGAASATTSRFMGLIANPKVYALYGTPAGGSLAASLLLPDETTVELVTEGDLFVTFAGACSPGDLVWFLIADGSLVTSAPGAAKPANTFGVPIGTVERYVSTGAGLGIVHLEPTNNLAA